MEQAKRAADWLTSAMERHGRPLAAAFTLILLAGASLMASTTLLWHDEFLTYYPAKLSLPDLFRFYHDALDTQTPTLALAIKGAITIFGDNHWAIRLPSILAFATACLAMFLFVERRLPRTYALAAMLFPAATITVFFATDARPYALLFAFTTLAMVCWQRASEPDRHWGWLLALGFSLAAAICAHYYAVVFWIPLGLAELVRWRERGKPDIALWLVSIAALFTFLIFIPNIQVVSRTYGGSGILSSQLSMQRFSYTILLARTLIPFPVFLGLLLLGVLSRTATPDERDLRKMPLAEQVLAIAVAVMVIFELPLAWKLKQYGERYIVECVAGAGIVLVGLFYWLTRGDKRFGAAMTVMFMGFFLVKTAATFRAGRAESGGLPFHAAQPYQGYQWRQELEHTPLPFVATPLRFFFALQYYAPPELRSRIVYPFDNAEVMRSGHPQNDDKYMQLWISRIPINAVPAARVMAPGSHFLMCVEASEFSWQLHKLLKEKANLRLLSEEGPYMLFDVQL